jgi:hypothetical protein
VDTRADRNMKGVDTRTDRNMKGVDTRTDRNMKGVDTRADRNMKGVDTRTDHVAGTNFVCVCLKDRRHELRRATHSTLQHAVPCNTQYPATHSTPNFSTFLLMYR